MADSKASKAPEENNINKNGVKNSPKSLPDSKPEYIEMTKAKEEEEEGNVSFQYFLELVGTKGPWNYWVIFLAAMCSFVSPMQNLSYQFLGDTPDHWCHVSELVEANWTQEQILAFAIPFNNDTGEHEKCSMRNLNYLEASQIGYEESMNRFGHLLTNEDISDAVSVIPCKSRDFNLTDFQSTTVTEWDLVCDRRYLYSTTFSASFIFRLFTSPFMGYILDLFGRRLCIVISAALFIPSGFLAAVAPNYETYIILRIIISNLDSCIYVGGFVLCLELSDKSQRSTAGVLFVIPWALGYMALPGIAYLVRDWRYLQAALTLPAFYMILYFWFLPESPRWLVSKGRFEEAAKILKNAAKMNGKSLNDDDILKKMKGLHTPQFQEKGIDDIEEKACTTNCCMKQAKVFFHSLWSLARSFPLLRMTIIVLYTWFASSVTYYGMSLNAVNLSADIYIYMFLGGLLELPSYLLLWPIVSFLGRKKAFITLFICCGLCIFVIPLLDGAMAVAPVAVKVTFSLIGKIAINMAFQLTYLYTGELYQTSQRSFIISLGNVFSAAGGAFAPYINDLFVEKATWAPPVTFGILSVLAGLLTLSLPETLDVELPETVEAVESSASRHHRAPSTMKG